MKYRTRIRYRIKARFERVKYKIKSFVLNIRYKIILWFIGKMPVIVNCTIYDDVMEYNFGKTRTYKSCICFNNRVKRFDRIVDVEISKREVYTGNDGSVLRKRNSFSLQPIVDR